MSGGHTPVTTCMAVRVTNVSKDATVRTTIIMMDTTGVAHTMTAHATCAVVRMTSVTTNVMADTTNASATTVASASNAVMTITAGTGSVMTGNMTIGGGIGTCTMVSRMGDIANASNGTTGSSGNDHPMLMHSKDDIGMPK